MLNCLYQSICLNIITAQWLKYWACEPKIMSSDPPGALVHIYWIKFLKNFIFSEKSKYICSFDLKKSYASWYLSQSSNCLLIWKNYFKVLWATLIIRGTNSLRTCLKGTGSRFELKIYFSMFRVYNASMRYNVFLMVSQNLSVSFKLQYPQKNQKTQLTILCSVCCFCLHLLKPK